jgi:hypothetical protein
VVIDPGWDAVLRTLGVPGALTVTLLAVFRAVYTGALIPRSTYDDILKDRDSWREAHALSEKRREQQDAQVDDLLEQARTTAHLLQELRRVADRSA